MKKTVFILMLMAMMCICAACGTAMQQAPVSASFQGSSDEEPLVLEDTEKAMRTDVMSVSSYKQTDVLVMPYSSIQELDTVAQLVFTGECVATEPVFQSDMLYTLSRIKVEQVFKGDACAGDILLFCENGGRVTNGEYNKGCNLPPIPESAKASVDEQIVVGIDGYYPFQQGEKVLVFADDISGFLVNVDDTLYGCCGAYGGKLLLQDDGSYARPPSETDKDIYKDSLVITMDDLKQYY